MKKTFRMIILSLTLALYASAANAGPLDSKQGRRYIEECIYDLPELVEAAKVNPSKYLKRLKKEVKGCNKILTQLDKRIDKEKKSLAQLQDKIDNYQKKANNAPANSAKKRNYLAKVAKLSKEMKTRTEVLTESVAAATHLRTYLTSQAQMTT